MPSDANRLFRVFADAVYFTQSRFKQVKFSLCSFVQKHDGQVSRLLAAVCADDFGTEDYISQLMKGPCDFEVTLVLLCELFHKNAEICFQPLPNTSEPGLALAAELTSEFAVGPFDGWTRFSLFAGGPSKASSMSHAQPDCRLLADRDDETRPRIESSCFWLSGDTSLLVLTSRPDEPDSALGVCLVDVGPAVALSQSLLAELVDKCVHDADSDDDFEVCESADATLVNRPHFDIAKPELTSDSRATVDADAACVLADPQTLGELPAFKSGTDPKGGTPNTASNSSLSGSIKNIGLRSKLNPRSQVYKASSSRSSIAFTPEGYSSLTGQRTNALPQPQSNMNLRKLEGFQNRGFSNQNMYYQSDDVNNPLAYVNQRFSSDTQIYPQK